MDKAKGRYLAFMDADDRLEKDYLKDLLDNAHTSGAEITQCSFSFVYDNGDRTPDPYAVSNVYHGTRGIMDGYFSGPAGDIRISAWAKLFRHDAFEKIRFDTDLKIYEDAYFTYLCCMKADTVCAFDKPLYLYCQHGGSAMHSSLSANYRDYFEVFGKMQEDLQDNRHLSKAVSRRKAETSLWLMHLMIREGRQSDLWELRRTALGESRRVFFSPAPLKLKVKLIGVALMPHLYFAMLSKKAVPDNEKV